jgi:hypothetical protein
MKIYLAGPMTGIPYFNFPAFHSAAQFLRTTFMATVFNPAERDMQRHGTDVSAGNSTGSTEQAEREHGLTLRVALRDDLDWICRHATHIALLPGWEQSKGCRVEHTLATALGLTFLYLPAQTARTVPHPSAHVPIAVAKELAQRVRAAQQFQNVADMPQPEYYSHGRDGSNSLD